MSKHDCWCLGLTFIDVGALVVVDVVVVVSVVVSVVVVDVVDVVV